MSSVILSADAYCMRQEIARKVAQALGYECISREVLVEASGRYGTTEEKLEEALRNTTSFLSRLSSTRVKLLAYFQASFTSVLKKDNVVYHGEAGHMFVSDVSHILKVWLMADLEERVALRVETEKIPEKKARELFQKEAEERKKWFQSVFGQDGADSGQFDLMINVTQIGPDRAANIIADTARDVKFNPITYSVKSMQDQELAGRVRAALIDSYPDVTVTARDGDVSIQAKVLKKEKKDRALSVREKIQELEGVNYVEIG